MRKIVYGALVVCLAITGCKKKEKEPTKTDLLQNGKWKLTAANFNGLFDLLSSFKDCQKDNTYTFNGNKTITADEGATKCSDTATQTKTEGTWAMQNDDTKLSVSGSSIAGPLGALSITADIVTLNNTTLQLKKDTVVGGFAGTANLTFTNVK